VTPTTLFPMALVALTAVLAAPLTAGGRQDAQRPTVQIPDAKVPEIMTIEGNFVRGAYNREGYVILGYQPAQRSLGEEWMLLEIGVTLLPGTKEYTLKREALSLDLPDGKTLPLPTVAEHREGDTRAVQNRARVQRDNINYFPPMASRPCRLGFFSDLSSPAMAWDEVSVDSNRACLGRLYFKIPGGIAYGQYWLNVKFADSVVRVPFRILTKDEEKLLSKNFKSIKRQVEDAFRPPKK
jgi:hypothetical protein